MVRLRKQWAAAGVAVAASGIVAATLAAGAAPAAAATKSAFVIGFANATQGQATFPGLSDGAQAAVQYVNAHGGINGHPLVLAVCDYDSTLEKNQACGQQFANDPRLKLVDLGFTQQAAALYAPITAAGLPILESYPVSDVEYLAPTGVAYMGGGVASSIGNAEIANAQKAQTVARIVTDNQPAVASTNYFLARFKGPKAGVKVVYVPGTATDPLPYLLQSGAATADIISLGQANCALWGRGLSQVGVPGTKVLATSTCLVAPNSTGPNAGLFEGWRAAFSMQDPGFGPITSDLKTLISEYPKYAKLPTANGITGYVPMGWGAILTLQRALRGQPDSVLNSKAALLKVMRAYRGPGVLNAAQMKCGLVKTLPSLCSTWTLKGQNRGGKLYKVAG